MGDRAYKFALKPTSKIYNQLFRKIAGRLQQNDFDRYASQQPAPQGFLLNLSDDGYGGRCDPLSKLVLVAKQLESEGSTTVGHKFIENLYAAASVINSPDYYSLTENNNAKKLMTKLKKCMNLI